MFVFVGIEVVAACAKAVVAVVAEGGDIISRKARSADATHAARKAALRARRLNRGLFVNMVVPYIVTARAVVSVQVVAESINIVGNVALSAFAGISSISLRRACRLGYGRNIGVLMPFPLFLSASVARGYPKGKCYTRY